MFFEDRQRGSVLDLFYLVWSRFPNEFECHMALFGWLQRGVLRVRGFAATFSRAFAGPSMNFSD